ncbi:MAG: dTMP kinase [Halobacteriaceae archaeon]
MLIALEGIDGSGKTTVWEVLQERFEFTFTAEPTDSWYGDAVRRSVADEAADPVAELFLYTADHADHLSRTVEPALEAGEVVVSDRYVDSRYAYQSVAVQDRIDHPLEYVRGVHKPWTREPDLTIYLDIDPETGAARSGATNKFEQAAFLGEVRTQYERLRATEPARFTTVDANQAPEAVVERVEKIIEEAV